MKKYQTSYKLGPLNTPACPACGNSLQNGEPYGLPAHQCCASCKIIFRVEMRSLSLVIQQMLDVIPSSEEGLRTRLTGIYSSVLYAAPEIMHTFWLQAADALMDEIGSTPSEEWHTAVINIWNPDTPIKTA